MAQDGMLPNVFAKVTRRSGAPWVAILVLAIGWALCLGLGFERLVAIDILVYGSSLLLEFIALVALRIREPNLPRPFKVPGGVFGTVFLGVLPTLLLGFSIFRSDHERVLGMNGLTFGALVILAGFLAYGLDTAIRAARQQPPPPSVAD